MVDKSRVTLQPNGEYSISTLNTAEVVSNTGERNSVNQVTKEETPLTPYQISREIDTETMSECITRSDNSLEVNFTTGLK